MDAQAAKRGLVLLAALLAAIALGTAACGGGGGNAASTGPVPEVHVHLDEWAVEPGVVTAAEGGAKFIIHAHNHGGIAHELLILKTDLDPGSLPTAKGKVDLAKAGEVVGQVMSDTLVPDATADVSLNLEPGAYVFICNIAGHYKQGMYAPFRVQ